MSPGKVEKRERFMAVWQDGLPYATGGEYEIIYEKE